MATAPPFPQTPFTWQEAKKLGIARHRLTEGLANHELRRVLRNVYLRSDVPDSQLIRCQAAALVLTAFAVVCDRTAAWLHGVDVFDYHELDILPALDTYVLRGHAAVRRPQCTGGTRDLAERDICVIHGIRVTTPLRTALDLGCKLSRRDALAALDAFVRRFEITRDELLREARRYFRRRGVVQLRRLLPLADPRAESPGESWTRLAIIDADLPWPEPQYWVYIDGVPVFRLDLAYPKLKVAVEYDGREFHTSKEQRDHDEARRRWLRDHGWTVIVLDKDSFSAEALQAWLTELRVALRLAA